MKKQNLLLSLIIFIIMISSCTSVQKDVMISTDTDEDMSLTYDFESRIAELDAEVLENKNKDEKEKHYFHGRLVGLGSACLLQKRQ